MDIRPSPIAGTWYPGDAESLTSSIDHYLHDAEPREIDGEIVGLIVPHAGHRYSGGVAAEAFQMIQGHEPEVVVVISPLHAYAEAAVLTSGHEAYATPLGVIPIDQALVRALEDALDQDHGITLRRVHNDREHALEIELPFLQRCIQTPFMLLPIMLREQRADVARALGQSLGGLIHQRDSLIVASSDLSHFYPQETAQRLDQVMLGRLAAFDPEGLIEMEERGQGFACGRGAMAAALWAAESLGADRVDVLKHATSGDITGDYQSVVGYGSAVIVREI